MSLIDWKANEQKRMIDYGLEAVERLRENNFPFMVSPEQAIAILEPTDAPENFYCDGEITHAQALNNWRFGLKAVGLTPYKIYLAEKFTFGE